MSPALCRDPQGPLMPEDHPEALVGYCPEARIARAFHSLLVAPGRLSHRHNHLRNDSHVTRRLGGCLPPPLKIRLGGKGECAGKVRTRSSGCVALRAQSWRNDRRTGRNSVVAEVDIPTAPCMILVFRSGSTAARFEGGTVPPPSRHEVPPTMCGPARSARRLGVRKVSATSLMRGGTPDPGAPVPRHRGPTDNVRCDRSSPLSRLSCSTGVPGPPGPPPTRRSSTGSRVGITPAGETPHWTISAQPPTRLGSTSNLAYAR